MVSANLIKSSVWKTIGINKKQALKIIKDNKLKGRGLNQKEFVNKELSKVKFINNKLEAII